MPNTRSAIAFWFQIGVPIFFLVDGFLFLYRLECHGKFNYTDYVLKSARRLLVPWAGFSLLYLLVRLAYEYIGNPFEQLVLHRGFTDIMIAIWVGASAGQMYFLLSLFILRSLAFATRYIPKLPSITVLCGVGVAGVIWWGIQNGMLPRGFQLRANWGGGQDPFVHAIWGLQYYLLGCSLYLYRAWLFRHARAVASGALLLFAGLSLSGTKWLFVQQYAYLVSVYSMFMVIEKGGGVLSTIGRHTMGVYLLHFPGILKLISVSFALVMDSTRYKQKVWK